MKTWNIGNTTVRNPLRIEDGLKVLDEKIAGREWTTSKEYQGAMWQELAEHKVIDSESTKERESLGRKWLACFKQLGFISVEEKPHMITVTKIGKALIALEQPAEDIFLRQMFKIRLPNYLENGKRYEDFDLHPFWLFVAVLYELQFSGDKKGVGLNKVEIALFLITCISNIDKDRVISDIISFREEYANTHGGTAKKRLINQCYKNLRAHKGLTVTLGTLMDYADSSLRYFLRTGLFSAAGKRIEIQSSKKALAEYVIHNAESFQIGEDEDQFQGKFESPDFPELPYDDELYLRQALNDLVSEATKVGIQTVDIDSLSRSELRNRQVQLAEHIMRKKEESFMIQQRGSVTEIVDAFDQIMKKEFLGGDMYAPAFYECNTWRGLLAIDDFASKIHETRNFDLDDSLYPKHHAKAGKPDMVFDYGRTIVVVETTLTVGENQWSTEREPVQRHVKDTMRNNPDKKVIGLFIAPKIHFQTYHTFLNETMLIDAEHPPVRIDVLPMTHGQFGRLIANYDFSAGHSNYLRFLEKALVSRNLNDGNRWSVEIENCLCHL